ncbi:splicing factor 3B subunit 1 [Piptocephalis cylindrospora]|uniref:Splicing factor 3B subunit 1 n=1 Tax=Piptocephalis cylindrospora TaxID=1907219 RepID=A0A4P9Y7H4_9FUNG|nr:splicing factor 3B subunit 1 [Piptocephalis cylindrospora]|eukprot:RKP15028.1 splicing factor 3B subunit 1 [Piptocephalis cylindrospora]
MSFVEKPKAADYSKELEETRRRRELQDPHKVSLSSVGQGYDEELPSYTAPQELLDEITAEAESGATPDPFGPSDPSKSRKIADRQSEYHLRRFNQTLSPTRHDAFSSAKPESSEDGARTYGEVMREAHLVREREKLMERLRDEGMDKDIQVGGQREAEPATPVARSRRSKWDETPRAMSHEDGPPLLPSMDQQKSAEKPRKRSRWDETPQAPSVSDGPSFGAVGVTETPRRSRWDETPRVTSSSDGPARTAFPPSTPAVPMTPEAAQAMRILREEEVRNRPLSDEELDAMLPTKGFKVLPEPMGYAPLLATPKPAEMGGFQMQDEEDMMRGGMVADATLNALAGKEVPGMDNMVVREEDEQYFGKLVDGKEESEMTGEEAKERRIMRLLFKVKNGDPRMRKVALRQLTDKARDFGAGPLFEQILPLLMSVTLEDQERHLLVKVVDRILYRLDDLVRPYAHKILVVIEPLLIDEDYYARVEGREIISNLSKAAGLATMIATMRPDIDHVDEFVRNTTARAFSVVASALGIPSLLPFLKAVCKSRKSWQARHTGIKIVQQIAILLGCAILPHLRSLVDIIGHGLEDEQPKVRTITALALSALAEASSPYGIESLDSVLKPLWQGIRKHRGKGLAAFLKAIGYIIPLMDTEYANHYTREVMIVLVREFQSPDEEMRKIVLKVVKQCSGTEGVTAEYLTEEVLPEYFRLFWVRRMALDRRNYAQLVETTVELARKVGVAAVASRLIPDLKDESEPYRKMVVETLEKMIREMGASAIHDDRQVELLIDGILYAFQEQTTEDRVILDGFGTVVSSLGPRCQPYLQQIYSTILWSLQNKSTKARQQAADLVGRVAIVLKVCGEEKLMGHMSVVLFEYLGEEYPEVLGSILGGIKGIVNVIGMSSMTPPIKDLLPRLTPILKNRHEKVQENCIDLVGRIADRGAEFVSAREWMRICFELLELLKARKKAIQRAAVNTFGYIAKAIGPQDVLATLLNNLKVQERQNRVCTTVAIAIVAETCSPFTVLPALMNEYRVPELNVQNDALIDRDQVHRQTACTTVKHLSLGVVGLGCEDALLHLLNFVWPNIFETSPHVINAVMDAIDGIRQGLGPSYILQYSLQGLFHPARRVREVYWRIYNNMYIGMQAGMVPYYPRVPSDERNSWGRTELDHMV